MNSIKRRRLIQILAAGLGAPGALPLWAASFENEHLRVVHFRFEPGARVPRHYVAPSLMVYVTDSAARFTNPAGKSWEEKAQAGEVRWWPGGSVRVEILSQHRIEFVQVVPK